VKSTYAAGKGLPATPDTNVSVADVIGLVVLAICVAHDGSESLLQLLRRVVGIACTRKH
jgi:hypothetical protein